MLVSLLVQRCRLEEGQKGLGQVPRHVLAGLGGVGEGGGQTGRLVAGGQGQGGAVREGAGWRHGGGGAGAHLIQGQAGLFTLEWVGGRGSTQSYGET